MDPLIRSLAEEYKAEEFTESEESAGLGSGWTQDTAVISAFSGGPGSEKRILCPVYVLLCYHHTVTQITRSQKPALQGCQVTELSSSRRGFVVGPRRD